MHAGDILISYPVLLFATFTSFRPERTMNGTRIRKPDIQFP